MVSNHDLIVIDTVARRGSFSAAAEELHKVPSAISYTVKLIEDKLEVLLFKRLHRRVQLTPAGEYFVVQARSLLKQMSEVKMQTQRVANWLLNNQRRLVVPNWHSAEQVFSAGLGIGVMPTHRATPLIEKGLLVKKELVNNPENSPCCLAWRDGDLAPAIKWLLSYLGDSEKLHQQWLAQSSYE